MIRKKPYILLAWVAAMVLVTGCDVHEFPDDRVKTADLTLHLDFTLELPPYKDIIYNQGEGRAEFPSDYLDIRYMVNIYRSVNGRDFQQQPDRTVVMTRDDVTQLDNDMPLTLEEGYYKFMVWTDFVDDGSKDDKYYSTSDFTSITVAYPHTGNDDYRDAFRGELTATVVEKETTDLTVEMSRPMGKYRFIATDFDRFLTRAEEMARAEWEESRALDPESAPSQMPAVNVNDYKVVMRYPGFMPHVFNMYTNRPADSRTGVTYPGRILRINDQEAELGFDYVFVNGKEAPVTVAVDIYDKKNNLIGSSGAIDVPLMRSMLTTVKGDFLTSKASGGVGVNPDFDGEFNIILP